MPINHAKCLKNRRIGGDVDHVTAGGTMSVHVTMALPKGTGGIASVGEEEGGEACVWDTGAADQTRTGPKSLEGSCAITTPQPHSVAEVMPATTIVGPAVFDRAAACPGHRLLTVRYFNPVRLLAVVNLSGDSL